jgi:hypothetical protein
LFIGKLLVVLCAHNQLLVMAASPPLPLFFRVLRQLAQLQYLLSAFALLVNLGFCLLVLKPTNNLAFVTLQRTATERGQAGTERLDLLDASPAHQPHFIVDKSMQQRLIYREPNAAKRLALALIGVTNSALGRSSLAAILFAMLTGRLLYLILSDLRLDTPFTDRNARRIRWLALLIISIDLYDFLAVNALRLLVPAFPLSPGSPDKVIRFIVLDPAVGGFGSWKFGLVLLVIAAVYKRGVAMAREAELTI